MSFSLLSFLALLLILFKLSLDTSFFVCVCVFKIYFKVSLYFPY